jgi:hypothetical protein
MKQNVYELTDSAKRKLLSDLSSILSDKEINKLVAGYANRLQVADDGEPFIWIYSHEDDNCVGLDYKYWLEQDDVVQFAIDSEE